MVLNSIVTHPQKVSEHYKKLFASHNSGFCTSNVESRNSSSLSFFVVKVSQLLFSRCFNIESDVSFSIDFEPLFVLSIKQLVSRLIDVLLPTERQKMFRIVNQCVKAQSDILTCCVFTIRRHPAYWQRHQKILTFVSSKCTHTNDSSTKTVGH